jgi:hypothetical protein
MNHRLSTQATAFGLAALVTLTLMASIDQLATTPAAADTMAGADAPTQVVVVTARRLPRS